MKRKFVYKQRNFEVAFHFSSSKLQLIIKIKDREFFNLRLTRHQQCYLLLIIEIVFIFLISCIMGESALR